MSDKPNILLIVSDQMTAALTGAYGHPVVKTPNLNRLVAEGIRFDAAYSPCPVCAPARGALMSGQYVSNCGTIDNAAPWPDDMVTIPHYLTLAGYDTVLSGKMHVVGADHLKGFDRKLTNEVYPKDLVWTPARQDPLKMKPGEPIEWRSTGGQAATYVGSSIQVDQWNQTLSYDEESHFRALEYLHAKGFMKGRGKPLPQKMKDQLTGTCIRKRGEYDPEAIGEQPFFLCISYHHPHEPFWPPKKYWDMYEDAEIQPLERTENLEETYSTMDLWLNDYHGCAKHDLLDPESVKRVRRAYYGLVTYVDDKVGELMASLEENGLADDTVIIFTADHGDMLCERGMVQKRCFYEWSAQIPMIVRFPDKRHGGTKVKTPVNLVDLLPTVCELADVNDLAPHDGSSMLPFMEKEDPERTTFAEIHSEGIHGNCFMARKGKHKYIYIHNHDDQLFDLEADPHEWNNLANDPAHEKIRQQLKAEILAQFDPEAIEKKVVESLRRRKIIREAMRITGLRWDVGQVEFHPSRHALHQYLP